MGDNKDYHNDYDNYDYYLITMLTCSFTDFILVGSQLESTIGNTIVLSIPLRYILGTYSRRYF